MLVKLDQEEWEAGAGATLGEVFADVSDRAHARSRLVTRLQLDQREITDRDIDAGLLAESASRYGILTAISQSMQDIARDARHAARLYAETLRTEGATFVCACRSGLPQDRADLWQGMDLWLGKLADYLEFVEGTDAAPQAGDAPLPLSSWVQQLLAAREMRDRVLTADLLEYEILPRLGA